MSEAHYRLLEQLYHAAPTNEYYKPRLSVSKGRAELQIEVKPEFFHGADGVHGSVYFKMLDDAAFFAANSVVKDVFLLTASFNLDFLRPVSEGLMRSEGRLVSASQRLLLADAEMFDGRDKLIARGSGTFMRSDFRLEDL